jgi:hypothetical protein
MVVFDHFSTLRQNFGKIVSRRFLYYYGIFCQTSIIFALSRIFLVQIILIAFVFSGAAISNFQNNTSVNLGCFEPALCATSASAPT